MACFHPLKGYRSRERTQTGKRKIVFNVSQAYADLPLTVPCGQCTGCRLERSRQWAIRCVHEAQLHPDNCFITLTYNDENLPDDRSVDHPAFQRFFKRLRKKYEPKKIRYYMCGEYGEKFGRPHYHACVFGHDFDDKVLWKMVKDQPLYTSKKLGALWSDENGDEIGFSTVGGVTFQSAAYVARYIMKKITGPRADDHYQWVDPETGEIHKRAAEYTQQSRRPGIASGWLKKYHADVYPSDFVVLNGKKVKPPKAYDRSYELLNPTELERLKHARVRKSKKNLADQTPERLKVREIVQHSKVTQLKRTIQ
ncbi:MAG: replication initiator protein [Microviridae sp.]|nr:MAG: replication initiator protein [Microviridae sp.]